MIDALPAEASRQVSRACDVIVRHLGPRLIALHLYGSALDGGLHPHSDIDLMATVSARLDGRVRLDLMRDLLAVSAPPGRDPVLRALELTVVLREDVVPWRYAPVRQIQFGEWLREDIEAGLVEPAVEDPDLAILLTKVRHRSIALLGPQPQALFEPVPASDVRRTLSGTLDLWNSPPDWAGDERNVLLTLARIWYSADTGAIAPKHVAAEWAAPRLAEAHRALLLEARQAYLGHGEDRLAAYGDRLTALIDAMKREIRACLASGR